MQAGKGIKRKTWIGLNRWRVQNRCEIVYSLRKKAKNLIPLVGGT
jgi:hypothetical protein